MKEQLTTKDEKRIIWLDLVKFIAIFMMIAVHCTDNVTPAERSEPWYNLWGSFYGSFMRPAIPLFVMVTGALLLPVKQNSITFYSKRLTRVVIPFLIWSVLYNLFPWFTLPCCYKRLFRLGRAGSIVHESPIPHFDDSFQFLSFCYPDVVCISSDRPIPVYAYFLRMGETGICKRAKIFSDSLVCFSIYSIYKGISHQRPMGNLLVE